MENDKFYRATYIKKAIKFLEDKLEEHKTTGDVSIKTVIFDTKRRPTFQVDLSDFKAPKDIEEDDGSFYVDIPEFEMLTNVFFIALKTTIEQKIEALKKEFNSL